MRDGRPVWVVANEGILTATLVDEEAQRLRARVHWTPATKVRRIDALCHDGLAVVRLETLGRRFTLHANDQDSATRFVALSRAVVQLASRPLEPRPALEGAS
jgi:L-ribulose-5-phosphate 3-epimerase UlaE